MPNISYSRHLLAFAIWMAFHSVLLLLLIELFFQQADALGQFFYGWELVLNLFDFHVVVGGNSHRGCDAFERILDVSVIFIAANQETDGRVLGWCFSSSSTALT